MANDIIILKFIFANEKNYVLKFELSIFNVYFNANISLSSFIFYLRKSHFLFFKYIEIDSAEFQFFKWRNISIKIQIQALTLKRNLKKVSKTEFL